MIFWIYQLLFPLVVAGVVLKLLLQGRGGALKESREQLRQRLGRLNAEELAALSGDDGVLWIHAASVGEVNAAAPLIELIVTSPRAPRVLLTTSTSAGQRRARSLRVHPDLAVLAPCDFLPCMRVFLSRTRPRTLLVIETELWPAMLRAAQAAGVQIAIANGRITTRAFSRYRFIRSMMRPLLSKISRAAVQTQADATRFAALGAPEAVLRPVGNMKNDLAAPPDSELAKANTVLRAMGWTGCPVWTAGSTWPDEEEAVLAAFQAARKKLPSLKLVLAPRHVERCGETQRLLSRLGITFDTYSTRTTAELRGGGADCLLVDELGALRALYAASDLAFVGGTLNSVGGHSLIEPAIAGKPVMFGPATSAVEDDARALEFGGGGVRVRDAATLASAVERLAGDEKLRSESGQKAAETARALAGATQRTFEFLSPLLFPES